MYFVTLRSHIIVFDYASTLKIIVSTLQTVLQYNGHLLRLKLLYPGRDSTALTGKYFLYTCTRCCV